MMAADVYLQHHGESSFLWSSSGSSFDKDTLSEEPANAGTRGNSIQANTTKIDPEIYPTRKERQTAAPSSRRLRTTKQHITHPETTLPQSNDPEDHPHLQEISDSRTARQRHIYYTNSLNIKDHTTNRSSHQRRTGATIGYTT